MSRRKKVDYAEGESSDEEEDFSASEDEWQPNEKDISDGESEDDNDEDFDADSTAKFAKRKSSSKKSTSSSSRKSSGKPKRTTSSLRSRMLKKYKPTPHILPPSPAKPISKDISKILESSKYQGKKSITSSQEDDDSDGSGDDYLIKPNNLNLKSSFFDVTQMSKTTSEDKVPEFDCNAGMNLSDSEDDEEEIKPTTLASKMIEEDEEVKTNSKGSSSLIAGINKNSAGQIDFHKLIQYNREANEAEEKLKNIKAATFKNEDNLNVSKLLAMGEGTSSSTAVAHCSQSTQKGKGNVAKKRKRATDLVGSDSDTDWEQVQDHSTLMSEQKDILQINIPLPTKSLDEKKKNTRDVEMMIKRRLNRDIKEQRAYLHKVSLLCHIAHGLYCNRVLNNPSLMAAALKLLPNKSCYPDGATCIKYFESIAKWFKQAIPIRKNQMYLGTNKRPKLGVSLALQIKYKEALCKKDFVLIFIILLRAMGIPCRLVINLTPFSIRPPQSELHSLSTKPKDVKVEQEKKVKTNRKGTENKEIDSTESSKKHAVSHKRHDKKTEKSSEHDQKPKVEKRKEKATKRDEKAVKNIEKAGEKKEKSSKSKEDSVKDKSKGTEKKELHSDKSNKKTPSKNTERKKEKTKNAKPQKSNKTDSTVLTLPKEISQTISESIVVSNSKQVSGTVTTSLGACAEPISKTEQNHPEISNITKSALKQDLSAENVEPLSEKLEIVPEKSSTLSNNQEVDAPPELEKCGGEMVMNSDCTDAPVLLPMVKTESNEDSITIGSSEIPGTVENTVKTSSSPLPPTKEEITESTKTSLSQKLKRNVKNKKTTATTSNEASGEPAEMETEHFKELQKNVPKRKKANTKQNDANELPITTTKKRGAKVESIYFQIPTRRTTRSRAKQQELEGTEQPTIPQMDGADDNTRVNLKKLKPKSRRPSNSDDDFVPSPPKKPRPSTAHTSSKGSRSKKERQVLSSSSEEDEKIKKKKMDIWVEVFSEKEEKWVPINLFKTQVDNPDELRKSATAPVAYVFAWDNDNSMKDVSPRYCPLWNTATRKQRVESDWLSVAIRSYTGRKTSRSKAEDIEFHRMHLDKPLPSSIAEYKNHPLYALQRHLLKFEAIYPPDALTLGFVRGEPVYARDCVHNLHSRETWLREARVVKPGEKAYKIVKARPKWDKLTNTVVTDLPLDIFGKWQTMEYDPPTAENGIVPRNAYGNVDLFKPSMLPKKTVHLDLPGLNKVCKKLKIDCAPAVVGFDFHQGACHPLIEGYVVCEEYRDIVIDAWNREQEEAERKEDEKYYQRVYGNWKKLYRGLLIRERLKRKYNFKTLKIDDGKPKKKKKTENH